MNTLSMTTFDDVVLFMPAARFNAEKAALEAAHTEAMETLKRDLASITGQLVAANETIQRQHQTIQAADSAYSEALRRNEGLLKTNREQAAQIDALKARLAALEAPPVIVPDAPKPEPVSDVYPFCAVYIEDPRKADNVDNQQQAKEHADAMLPTMEFCAQSKDITDYIMFLNPEDLKYGVLPKAKTRLNKIWWQSPAQAYYIPGAQTQTVLIDHLKALHDAGCYGAIIDDANNLDAADMTALIELIHRHMPGAPIIASFLANFDDHTEGYPHERYIDMRQWFLRNSESEAVWFDRWETAHDAELWAADVWKRPSGFMHTPARLLSMAQVALPMVNGVAFYSMLNKETNHMADHQKHVAEKRDGLTMWSAIQQIAAEYVKLQTVQHPA